MATGEQLGRCEARLPVAAELELANLELGDAFDLDPLAARVPSTGPEVTPELAREASS
jgi:hypothetical protein